MLESTVKQLEKTLEDQTLKANADITKANEQIYELQAGLSQKTAMIEGMVEKAISEIKNKLVSEFKQEKIVLMDQVNSMESKLRDAQEKLVAAEEGRTSLIDANNNLEDRLAVYSASIDPKIKKVLDKASEDPEFYKKIIEAAEVLDLNRPMPEQNIELEKLKKDKTELLGRVNELQQYLDDGSNFIEVLQLEIKQLKEKQAEDRLTSKFGLLSEQSPESRFQSNPGLPLSESMLESPFQMPSLPKPTILTTWRNLLYVKEGSESMPKTSAEIEAQIALLTKENAELSNSFKSVSKYLDDAKAENKTYQESMALKDADLAKSKTDLASKSIQLSNAQSKLSELRRLLESMQNQVPQFVPMLAYIDDEKPAEIKAQTVTMEITDISDKLKANKQKIINPLSASQEKVSSLPEDHLAEKHALEREIHQLKEEIISLRSKFEAHNINLDLSPVNNEDSSPASIIVFHQGDTTSKSTRLEICQTDVLRIEGTNKANDIQLHKSLEDEQQDLIAATSMTEESTKIDICVGVYKYDVRSTIVQACTQVVESAVTMPVQNKLNRVESFEHGMPALPKFATGIEESVKPTYNRADSFQQGMPALPKFTGAETTMNQKIKILESFQQDMPALPKFTSGESEVKKPIQRVDSFQQDMPALPKFTGADSEVRQQFKRVDSFQQDMPALPIYSKTNQKKDVPEESNFFSLKPTKIEELSAIQEIRESKDKSLAELQDSIVLSAQKGTTNLIQIQTALTFPLSFVVLTHLQKNN